MNVATAMALAVEVAATLVVAVAVRLLPDLKCPRVQLCRVCCRACLDCRLQIRGRSQRWESTVVSVSPDKGELTLSSPLPCPVVNDAYEYCQKLSPLLAYNGAAEGFWPIMCTTAAGCTAETAALFRALGWCMAAGLVNRVPFSIRFSRVLMTQVIHGVYVDGLVRTCRRVCWAWWVYSSWSCRRRRWPSRDRTTDVCAASVALYGIHVCVA